MVISLFREPTPKIIRGPGKSVIVDKGELHKAIPGSQDDYIFSEFGAGVQPLVAIGTFLEIAEFLAVRQLRGIQNNIGVLPNIYVSISKYKPGFRFDGLFPLHDAANTLIRNILDYTPSSTITDILGGSETFISTLASIMAKDSCTHSAKILYVKFSYFIEDGAIIVGSNRVSFGDILKKIFT